MIATITKLSSLLMLWFRMFRRPLLIFGVFNRDTDGHSLPAKERSRVQILQDSVRISVNGAFKNSHAVAGTVVVDDHGVLKGLFVEKSSAIDVFKSEMRYWQVSRWHNYFICKIVFTFRSVKV
uniref:Uncharacterized protein n=1 Tax=Cannabis sativa TaxID=3483 RepID=A0A803PFN1_CANSA